MTGELLALAPATFARLAKCRAAWLLGAVILFNLLTGLGAYWAFAGNPVLLGTGVLAFALGLRHGVDADHIAAIDNATRKILHDGRSPSNVGVMFSMGHSSVVLVACLALLCFHSQLQGSMALLRSVGGWLGPLVSTLFLVAVALMNVGVLRSNFNTLRAVHRCAEAGAGAAAQGPLTRLLAPVQRLVTRGWHMYPLGVLFGLGFDTASEIILMCVASMHLDPQASPWLLIGLPLLFMAAMMLVDSADGLLMLAAYRWALVDPLRKLHYNLVITSLSLGLALLIATVQLLAWVAEHGQASGPLWNAVARLNDGFAWLGIGMVALLGGSWFLALAVQRWSAGPPGQASGLPN